MKQGKQETKGFTEEEIQQFKKEGLVEVSPGIWGIVGEHVEPDTKDYEHIGDGCGYWIVGK